MKRLLWTSGAFLLVALCLLMPARLRAEQVSHHELMVDANISAQECIGCHDGSMSKRISFCTVRCDFSGSHSMMKRYPPRGKEALYAPVASVRAKGIKLENGHVTCNSCHNLRKSSPNHLVMENTGSKLCLTCHIRM